MNEIQSFKRFPAIRCWIKNIMEGKYSIEKKSLYTIFGDVKRVRIVATVIDKREIISPQSNDDDFLLEEGDHSNLRIEFDLDDGTGLIRAILWRANPDQFKNYIKGDIIDIIGLIRKWREYISISPEIIKKIKDPNFILLRDAEIIKKISSGEIQDIPEDLDKEFDIDKISSENDINDLFEGKNSLKSDNLKSKIYSIVEKNSIEGHGISFKEIKEIVQISEDKLRKYIRDLEMESRIYPSEKDIYQTY
ncbi:MAG: OB-fold nucleic acid binding domain-containing protein [Candidatus Thorarchaeota archaeon]